MFPHGKSKPTEGTSAQEHRNLAGARPAVPITPKFDYDGFYETELDKKHKDKSYRYFNNINRLAKNFPRAHMATAEEEVTVWCSNDYLGMGRNPITALAPAAPETSPATISMPFLSRPPSPNFMLKKPLSSSRPATLQTMQPWPRWALNCPIA